MARRGRFDRHLAWLAGALLELEDKAAPVALSRKLSEQKSGDEVVPFRGRIRNSPFLRVSSDLPIQRAFEKRRSQLLQQHSIDDRRSAGCSETRIRWRLSKCWWRRSRVGPLQSASAWRSLSPSGSALRPHDCIGDVPLLAAGPNQRRCGRSSSPTSTRGPPSRSRHGAFDMAPAHGRTEVASGVSERPRK